MRAGIIFAAAMAVREEKKYHKFLNVDQTIRIISAELTKLGVPKVLIGKRTSEEQGMEYLNHEHAICLVKRVLKYPPDKFDQLAQLAISEPNLHFPD